MLRPPRLRWPIVVAALAVASPALGQDPLPEPDPDRGFRCSWQDVTVRERASLPTAGLVLERPYLTLRFDAGVFVPLEACGELVGLAWKGTGEAEFGDPGQERGHRLHDRLGNVPGMVTIDSVVLVASDGAVAELVEAAGGLWEETPLPLDLRTTIGTRFASFDVINGRSRRPPGELLFAPDPSLGGFFADVRSPDFKRSFKGRLELPLKWVTYEWSNNGRSGGEPGGFSVREVGADEPMWLSHLADPAVLGSDNPYALSPLVARFDVKDVQAHLLFEPTPGLDRDLVNLKAVTRMEVQARDDGFATVPLWLAEGRRRTLGEQWGELIVSGVKADDVGVRFHRSGDRLFVELPEAAVDGQVYVLEIAFHGALIEPLGQENITALSGTMLHPMGLLGDRFTFSSMVTAPKFWKVVSTGRVIEEMVAGKAVTVTSRCDRPIDEALVFVIDGRTDAYAPPGADLPVLRIVRTPDTMAINARFADQVYEQLAVLNELLGPFPYDELEIVERRLSLSFVDQPGVITVPIFDAPPDQLLSSRAGRVSLLQALGRQYVSADMGANSYHDRWLIEALAVQVECYLLEQHGTPGRCAGALRSMRDAWTEMVMSSSTDWLIGPVWMGPSAGGRPVGAFSEPNTQARGPLVLHRLRLLMGDAMTRELIRRIATSYRGQSLSTLSFLIQAQAVAGVDLRGFFYGWVYATPQVPTLRLLWQPQAMPDGTWTLHLGGVIDSGREGDPLPFVSPTMVRIKYGKEDAWQRIVLTHEAQDFAIAGIPAEPKSVDVDWQTFPGKVEIKKQR